MRITLRKTLFILPNLFTLSTVFCGLYAAILCSAESANEDVFYRAALLIVFAMFFDTLDGRVARFTRTQSAFGVQLDSLADVVAFGVAPALLVYRWSLSSLGHMGLVACFVFCAAGAIRLARFNVLSMDVSGAPKKPGKYILGLPIPGAAGCVVSLVVANRAVAGNLPGLPLVVMVMVLVLAGLMVSAIPFRSFKDLKLSWQSVTLVVVALSISLTIAVKIHISLALIWLLTSYIFIGLAEALIRMARRIGERRAMRWRTSSRDDI